jgi:probable addiction module antidote protein
MPKTSVKKPAKAKTTAYDVAEHLRTPEEMAAYLDAWLNEAPDDTAGIARALGNIARAKGMTQVAKDAGLSRESLYRALSAEGNPSFATVLKVAKALGMKLHAAAAFIEAPASGPALWLPAVLNAGPRKDKLLNHRSTKSNGIKASIFNRRRSVQA